MKHSFRRLLLMQGSKRLETAIRSELLSILQYTDGLSIVGDVQLASTTFRGDRALEGQSRVKPLLH